MENSTAPLTSPQSPSNPNLRPTKSTAFKREERRKRKERKRQEKLAESLCCWDPLSSRPSDRSDSSISVSDTPWPCDPDPPPPNDSSSFEWEPFVRPCAPQKPTPLSPLVSSKDVQTRAIEMCKSFFVVEKEEENGDCTDEEGEGYERVLGFFSDLFRTHAGLTRFYEERRDKGVLICLVCGKKFGSCISLLHHASTVTKTRWRRAHRVYGVAMSQILGLKAINQVLTKEMHLTNLLNLIWKIWRFRYCAKLTGPTTELFTWVNMNINLTSVVKEVR